MATETDSESGALRFTIALNEADARMLRDLYGVRLVDDPDATLASTVRAALRRGLGEMLRKRKRAA